MIYFLDSGIILPIHESRSGRPDIPAPTDQKTGIQGYEYPPFSILHNPALQQAHELYLTRRSQTDELTSVRWLYSLTQLNSEAKLPFGERFHNFSDNSPLSTPKPNQIEPTKGLLIYTSSRLEHLLRLQAVTTPEGTNNGISMMLSSELAQLSNAYRRDFQREQGKPYLVDIAHSLAMYALRYKQPDHHGYSQSLGHWLHLPVSIYERYMNEFDQFEEVLKLSLALEEIGYGAENNYVQFLVRDLKALYELKGEPKKAQELEDHYKNIPSIENEIEKAWRKEYDLNRKKRMEEQAVQQPKRKRKRRR